LDKILQTIILGIIEGLTEFLPVSSTGHLFIASHLLGAEVDDSPAGRFWKAFNIVIQIGAIFAVVVYFRRRIVDLALGALAGSRGGRSSGRVVRSNRGMTPLEISRMAAAIAGPNAIVAGPGAEPMAESDVAAADALVPPGRRRHAVLMICLASVPLVLGLVVGKVSEKLEEIPSAIALALLIGGLIMILIERLPIAVTTRRMEDITWRQALLIGCCQILAALFPGTSRSAATIMPGLAAGLSRPAATEFSFFLAIPAMFAACGYKLLKYLKDNHPNGDQLLLLAVGTVVSFMVAWVVIAGFMAYIRRHNFVSFAWYRIVLGAAILLWAWRGGFGHR
jgi:undecaprenyl-diphosphatase